MKKRILSVLLAISLCFGLLVVPAERKVYAKENNSPIKLYEFKGYVEDSSLKTVSKSYGALDKSIWNSFSNDYFYNKMNQNQKNFYDGLKAQAEDFFYNEKDANSFKVSGGGTLFGVGNAVDYSGLTSTEASDIYAIFSNANPQFYFLSNTSAFDSKNYYICCFPEYANALGRKAYNQKFFDVVNSYLSDVKNYSNNKEERQRRIHTLLSEKLKYATKDSAEWGPHQSTATAVFTGTTVCAGYSELYALLCNAIGIPCICITSTNPNHEWNMVNYGKYWYCVDLTYDDTDNYRSPLWKYYNQPISPLFEDAAHNPDPIYKELGIPEAKYNFGDKPLDDQEGTIYRMFNKNLNVHFFTANKGERDALLKYSMWRNEGVAFISSSDTSTPVYRAYSEKAGSHYYSTDVNAINNMINNGWRDEGIAFYSDPNKAKPIYALRHPQPGIIGGYYYTENYEEAVILITKYGFLDLGIGWYGCEED